MNKKMGRNDPCPCGSSKKYKNCCFTSLSSPKTTGVMDLNWRQLRQLEGKVFDRHLIPYALEELPQTFFDLAISDCLPENFPEILDTKLLFEQFLLPWCLFNWVPGEDMGHKPFEPEMTLAENYIKFYQDKLNSQERRFIDAMNLTYYSFYSVRHVEFNQLLEVKDILLGTTYTVKEQQATHQLKRGDIVLSRILTLDQQSIFVGMAPFIVPVGFYNHLLDFKAWLIEENNGRALTPTALRNNFSYDLIDYFFEIMKAIYNQPLPTLVNTDDEPIQFSKSYFKLSLTPEQALQRLLPLTLSENPEVFLQNAKRNASGGIESIECPWLKQDNKHHKNWDNTLMGDIVIEKGQLILKTNSEQRAKQGKTLLTQYLGDAITFQQTLIETPEQKLKSSSALDPERKAEEESLMALPEVQEQLQATAQSHWQEWFNKQIPALDHQTPRQAAQTEKGRERLEALLLQYERHNLEKSDHPFKADITYLKSELGLE